MRDFDMTKKDIADYCRDIYLDETLTKKQITDRLRNFINRHLGKIGVIKQVHKAGGLAEDDYVLRGADNKGIHGVSHNLRQWIDAIKSLNMKHHLIEKNIEKAAKDLAEFIPDLGKQLRPEMSIGELRDTLTVLRKNERRNVVKKILSDIRIEHHACYLLQPAYEWSRKVATENDGKSLAQKVSAQIKVNPDFAVSEAERLVAEGIEKANANVKYSLALGLAIATGRRRTEIFKTAKFWSTETTPENHVMFSGQLKTHDRVLVNDVKPYPIPTLISPELVIKGLKVLRKLQSGDLMRYQDVDGLVVEGVSPLDGSRNYLYHNRAVSSYYAHSSQAIIRKVFDNPNLEFRHSRDMYSAIGYQKFKKPGEAESVYRTRVYGHAVAGSGSGDSQKHYEKFELDNSIEKAEFLRGDGLENIRSGANKNLVSALTDLDEKIELYLRSPNMKFIHSWLKEQLDLGLTPSNVSASYIRRYCLIDGKVLNLATCNRYLSEQIDWPTLIATIPAEPLTDIDDDENDIVDDDNEEQELAEERELKSSAVDVKPKLSVSKDGDVWVVTISVSDEVVHESRHSGNKIEAMKKAWAEWECIKTPPKPRISKEAGGWRVRLEKNGQIVYETWQRGTQAEAIKTTLFEWESMQK